MNKKSLWRALAAAGLCWAEREEFSLSTIRSPRSPRGGVPMPVVSPDGGFTNIDRTHIFGKTLGIEYPVVWHSYFTDFDVYNVGDWTITDTAAGTSGLVTGLVGGALAVAGAGAGNGDLRSHQLVKASFMPAALKPFAFGARVKISDATKGLFAVGLQSVNANPYAPPADGIWFLKGSAANTHIDFKTSSTAAGLVTTADIAEAADNTFINLEFVYDGESKIHYGANGVELGVITDASLPSAVALAPVFAVKNGEAVSKILTVDWVFVAQKR